ncbi:uncharacterized protein LOC756962 [Strongylocentrotus purpuratus]|uniref:TIR domain-containing protein n=1 Tax=Strongylocentrotus purpuratus TaxID=7668 RepID=A0A7M7PJQ0_STRPU|nr:uncharacterized protein LOC756962 [Strongylocentrotus purpuratus]
MAAGDGLIVENSIKVLTQNGVCQIDLCLGDITKLKKEDGVDVLVVSAFRGSYVESRTSVIGALSRGLNVSVATLAQDKEEDLRSLYSCWWSKPLPDHLAFRRVLCFETRGKRYDGRPQELVANVFRCLVSILKNEDGSVISPLLNTGDQGYGEASMLKGMVQGAVGWMKAGLPLRVLKLVLYCKVQDGKLQKHSLRCFDTVIATFNELKERFEMQLLLPKEIPLEFDIYLSFSEEDGAVAKEIREKLTGAKDGIRIYDGSQQTLDKDSVFQQDMYSVMMKSARVVTVLTPNYLQNKACVDQYNIALCCNRRANRDVLAPVYVHSVDIMPTYMGLVQYVDCRPADQSKIQEACSQVGVSLSVKLHKELAVAHFDPLYYDIFLSYSHCDSDKANRFVETFKSLAPELKIFFDVQELKTGKSWQRTLYHSIDGSQCMLALISTPYLKSAVCQEEFALAQAKHFSKGKQHLQLIPICLENLDTIQPEFTHIPMVKGTPDVFEDVVKVICPAVTQWIKEEELDVGKNLAAIFDKDKIPTISPDDEMEALRAARFQKNFGTSDSLLKESTSFPPPLTDILPHTYAHPPEHLIFSFHSEDEKYVDFIGRVLKQAAPGLQFSAVPSNVQEKLEDLEKANCIVPILSPHYLESPECAQEFHVAIGRQRIANPDVPLMLPIRVLEIPEKPTYFHLVGCDVSVTDAMWPNLAATLGDRVHDAMKKVSGGTDRQALPHAVCIPLVMAAYKILQRLAADISSDCADYPAHAALVNMMRLREQVKQVNQPEYTDDITQKLVELTVGDKA